MNSISFTVEEENLICMYHHDDRRRTMTAISDALPDMDADMRQLAGQTIQKLHNMTDAAFEEAKFSMALSDTELKRRGTRRPSSAAASRISAVCNNRRYRYYCRISVLYALFYHYP